MATTLLVITSITAAVLHTGLLNSFCKTRLKTAKQMNLFNILIYSVSVLMFGLLLLKEKISAFTIIFGLLFGVVTALGSLFKMLSLSSGPLNITLLITTASMIIPTMSGVFFGETFSPAKLCITLILIGFIYLSISKGNKTKADKKWFLFCILSFLFQGIVGVLQKIHQSSVHKAEVSGFLFVSFICALLFSLFESRNLEQKLFLDKKTIFVGLICGACTFAMNFINLKLSGLLPSQLFFPLINGSSLIFSSLMSVILFKERLSKRQTIGMVGGITSLIVICLVP